MDEIHRKIIVFQDHFTKFYAAQPLAVQRKIDFTFRLIRGIKLVPVKYLKHLEGSDALYEIRVEIGSNIYRIFCCFDEGALVVLFNAFQKKTQKTPKQELEKASQLKAAYFHTKSSTS